MTGECHGMGMQETLQHIPGLTYRQLDYWTRSGRLTNHRHRGASQIVIPSDSPLVGSGYRACWPLDQVILCGRLFLLVRCGFELDAAHQIAHDRHACATVIRQLTEIETDLLEFEQQLLEQLAVPT